MPTNISNISQDFFSIGQVGSNGIRYRKSDVKKYFFTDDETQMLTIEFFSDEIPLTVALADLRIESSSPADANAAVASLDTHLTATAPATPASVYPEYASSTEARDAGGLDDGELFRTGEVVKQVIPVIIP